MPMRGLNEPRGDSLIDRDSGEATQTRSEC